MKTRNTLFAMMLLALGLAGCAAQEQGALGDGQGEDVIESDVIPPGPEGDSRSIVSTAFPLELSQEQGIEGIRIRLYEPDVIENPDPNNDYLVLDQVFWIDWNAYANGSEYVQIDMKVDPSFYFAIIELVDADGEAVPTCAPYTTEVFEALAHTNVSFGEDYMGIASIACVQSAGEGTMINLPVEMVEIPATVQFCDGNHVSYVWTKLGFPVNIVGCATDIDGAALAYTWEILSMPQDFPANASITLVDLGNGNARVISNWPGVYVIRERVYSESGSMNYFDWRFGIKAGLDEMVRMQAETGTEVSVDLTGSTFAGFNAIPGYTCVDSNGDSVSLEAPNYEVPVVYYAPVTGTISMALAAAGDPVVQAFVLANDSQGLAQASSCIAYDVDPVLGALSFAAVEGHKYTIMVEAAGLGSSQSFVLNSL